MREITLELLNAMETSPYANELGFRLLEVSRGYAKVAVRIHEGFNNFLGRIDGGIIMSLADYAFACSCNTFGQMRYAGQFNTSFISTPDIGSELIAEGVTVHAGRTTALTEITVRDGQGKLIAKATGMAITEPKSNY